MKTCHTDKTNLWLTRITNQWNKTVWVHELRDADRGDVELGPHYPTLKEAFADTCRIARMEEFDIPDQLPFHHSDCGKLLIALGTRMRFERWSIPDMIGPQRVQLHDQDVLDEMERFGLDPELAELFLNQSMKGPL